MNYLDFEKKHDINDLITIMRILRSENGCPWDRVQTHESIRQDCLEEAYEVCEAIDKRDSDLLKEELGDLLLQVVFHSTIEEELGHYDFDDVCDAVSTKLINRHPHVFVDREMNAGAEKYDIWESAKRKEHGQTSTADAVDGVAHTLPSLWRLSKMIKKANKAGFNNYGDIRIQSNALINAMDNENYDIIESVFADFILTVVNKLYDKIDLEKCLQAACDDFAVSFRNWEEGQELKREN